VHTAKSAIVVVLTPKQAPVEAKFGVSGIVHVPPVGLHVKVGMAVFAVAPAAHVTVETEAT